MINMATLKFKLIAGLLSLLTIVILSMSVFYFFSQKSLLIEQNQSDIDTLSDIMVNNMAAALLFDDPQTASETLLSLQPAEHIMYAEVLRMDGSSFARYERQAFVAAHRPEFLNPSRSDHITVSFRNSDGLHAYHPIISDGQTIGIFYLVDDLSELNAELHQLLINVTIIALVTILLSILIGLRLVATFIEPLNDMLFTINSITHDKDFTKRAESQSITEFKLLADAFNDMISEIEQRDNRLATLNSELEERIQARTAELETALTIAHQASETKSNFLAVMSHELRTPLNGIIGFSELLSMSEVAPEVEEHIDLLNQSANNLMELVNEILDFSKLEANKVELEEKNIDAFSFMSTLKEINKIKARRKNLDLNLEVDPQIKNFLGDPLRIRQILNNFLDNAIKFTSHGSVEIKLKRQIHRRQPTLIFEVQDSGTGIDSSKLEHIFTPFSQADSSVTRKYGGTGLGLAICAQLIQLMHGTYGVESEQGKGSLFWFRLPLRQNAFMPTDGDNQASRSAKQVPNAEEAFNHRLLLAEDNITNQKLAIKLFSQFGLTPDIANNGREAVEMAKVHHYDLIFMDYHMPEMSGLEAVRIIRQPAEDNLNLTTPIIAMTADTQQSINAKLVEAGIDEIFLKPYRFADLKALLDRWL
jgi:signal transduction histidine kinase/CheY-like chemotaxis protein